MFGWVGWVNVVTVVYLGGKWNDVKRESSRFECAGWAKAKMVCYFQISKFR